MLSTLWLKTWRDLWLQKRQSVAVVLSIAVSTFTLGVILITYSILSKALDENFQQSTPSAMSFFMNDKVDDTMLADVKQFAGIERVESSRVISASIQNQSGESYPLYLFLVRDFNDIQLDVIDPEKGVWPPRSGEVLIEQQALSVLNGKLGDQVTLSNQSGLSGKLTVVGTAHDVSLAQAEWENAVYAYVSLETFTQLGGSPYFDELKISLKAKNLTLEQLEQRGSEISAQLARKGYSSSTVRIAPNEPPHANITSGMFMIQIAFAIMCCFLSAILVVNLISSILHKQLNQIGVMKVLGARAIHIRKIYYRGVFSLSLLGIVLSLPFSYWLACRYADRLAIMMNIDIFQYGVPLWIIVVILIFGLCVPLIVTSLPILRAAKITIKETLMEFRSELIAPPNKKNILARLEISTAVRLSLRNIVRRKLRFFLSCLVLGIGGGVFITTYNISTTMGDVVERDKLSKNWNAMIQFEKKISNEKLITIFGANTDTFFTSEVSLEDPLDRKSSKKTVMLQLSLSSTAFKFRLLDGQWLNTNKRGVVFSQSVAKEYPDISVGDTFTIEGWGIFTLEGIIELFGAPTIFSYQSTQLSNGFFVDRSKAPDALKKNIELANKNRLTIKKVTTANAAGKVVEDHLEIIFSLMLILTLITLFIAASGVVLTITTNTLERTREIGTLKAVGASHKDLRKMLANESIAIAVVSWFIACALMIPVSWLVSYLLGILLIQTPLPLSLNMWAITFSLPILILICLVSSLFPARQIARLPVHEALRL